ncbi:hypothetical protein CRE_05210 [Caenorhabditis remanei]|uniref:Protein kinase domain-containing protein n=1 Tax=Caenorhabditis remanei TaxID=31234 RepID=E3NEA3_CAERE|nr:hypothetical protein CRE_05210 [Caenorhabditis remanei]
MNTNLCIRMGFLRIEGVATVFLSVPSRDTKSFCSERSKSLCYARTTKSQRESKNEDFVHIRDVGQGTYGLVGEYRSKRTGHRVLRNVVHLYQCFSTQLHVYLVMELMTTNLSKIIDSSGRLDEYDASQVLKSIGEALSYCHFKQLIHRDVKPDNILISGDSVKLGDFGVSTFEQGRTICDTEGYMAPKIITDQMYSYQVDSYALGVIVHQILTTTMPFNDEKDGGKSKKWKFETNESFNEDIVTRRGLLGKKKNATPSGSTPPTRRRQRAWWQRQSGASRP